MASKKRKAHDTSKCVDAVNKALAKGGARLVQPIFLRVEGGIGDPGFSVQLEKIPGKRSNLSWLKTPFCPICGEAQP